MICLFATLLKWRTLTHTYLYCMQDYTFILPTDARPMYITDLSQQNEEWGLSRKRTRQHADISLLAHQLSILMLWKDSQNNVCSVNTWPLHARKPDGSRLLWRKSTPRIFFYLSTSITRMAHLLHDQDICLLYNLPDLVQLCFCMPWADNKLGRWLTINLIPKVKLGLLMTIVNLVVEAAWHDSFVI